MNLAPNGKPSNLTPEQYKLVRTPAFKAWFGDWEKAYKSHTTDRYNDVSKVIDENSEPLVVYHASQKIINQFKKTWLNFYQLGRIPCTNLCLKCFL